MSRMSIAWRADASSLLPCLGAAARVGHEGSRRPAVRMGARLDSAERPPATARAGATSSSDWVAQVMADTDAFFTPAPTTDYTLERAGARRRPHADVSERASRRRIARTTRCTARLLRAAARHGAQRRAAVLVLPQWNADPGGHVGLCRLLAMNGMTRAAPQPAVSRSAHAAGAAARRLHRQRQRRAHGAGLPAGGPRRAAGDRLAGAAGIRSHRHPRHEPRLVPVAADDGARAADRGAGAQSHLAALRRRRLARPLDAPRPRGARRPHRARSAARRCGSRSARAGIWSACATARRCSSTRATT